MDVALDLDPAVVHAALDGVDSRAAEASWTAHLRGHKGRRLAVERLLSLVREDGPLAEVKRHLRRRFPRLSRRA
jgi:hypothetical protein